VCCDAMDRTDDTNATTHPPPTERLTFECWNPRSEQHVRDGLQLWGNSDVMVYLGAPWDEATVRSRLETEEQSLASQRTQYWRVLKDGVFVGVCGVRSYEVGGASCSCFCRLSGTRCVVRMSQCLDSIIVRSFGDRLQFFGLVAFVVSQFAICFSSGNRL
jgi:hypothetical protein